ncbi:MAG: hypothetical protein ACXVRK_02730 [Gaiellaceae bacterium]
MSLVRTLLLRRLSPLGIALTLYDLWRRVPWRHPRRFVSHGGRQARRVVPAARALRERAAAR